MIHSPLMLTIPLSLPRSSPLEKDTCSVRGLMDSSTFHGVFPFFVCILTIPLFKSPYSAEGTPVMTSTDSISATEMLRVSIPVILPKEELLPMRTPSTSIAVPKAALPADEPPSRREKILLLVKSGTFVFPPGRRAEISLTFDICRCSSALLPMLSVVFSSLFGACAVTITSFRASVFSFSCIFNPLMLLFTFTGTVAGT